MPPPFTVKLVPHLNSWAETAQAEITRLRLALRTSVVMIHHIGSTAIPGIHSKPIIDLAPEVHSLTALDNGGPLLQSLGYELWGEYGIPGRRYCTLDDPETGQRRFQLHCFEVGHREIGRHVAFRDFLRANPDIAREYDAEKHRCQQLHPNDSHAYSDAKAGWIVTHLVQALAYYSRSN